MQKKLTKKLKKWLEFMEIDHYLQDKPAFAISNKIEKPKIYNQDKETTSNKNLSSRPLKIKPVSEKEEKFSNPKIEEARNIADKAQNLEELRFALQHFDGCLLKLLAKNLVFADGNAENAELMLIGEAPGASEDEAGIPFCGESGQLLDNMMAAIGFNRRENLYITNTVFWRPPANRVPTDEEINICKPFTEKHIALVKPKMIILVGATAVSSIIGSNSGITKLRGQYFSYSNKYLEKNIPLTSIFHPAYVLRQQSQKKNIWIDLLSIKLKLREMI